MRTDRLNVALKNAGADGADSTVKTQTGFNLTNCDDFTSTEESASQRDAVAEEESIRRLGVGSLDTKLMPVSVMIAIPVDVLCNNFEDLMDAFAP
jgi:hypothetical protein